jgi:hypothetical protein
MILADRKGEICGALNRPLSSFIYDAGFIKPTQSRRDEGHIFIRNILVTFIHA